MTRNQNQSFESRFSANYKWRKYPIWNKIIFDSFDCSLHDVTSKSNKPKETKHRPYLGGSPALINHLRWQSWVQGWLISWEKGVSQHSNLGLPVPKIKTNNALIQVGMARDVQGWLISSENEVSQQSNMGPSTIDKTILGPNSNALIKLRPCLGGLQIVAKRLSELHCQLALPRTRSHEGRTRL